MFSVDAGDPHARTRFAGVFTGTRCSGPGVRGRFFAGVRVGYHARVGV